MTIEHKSAESQQPAKTFVLHCWRADRCWRFSLVDIETNQRIGFRSLFRLIRGIAKELKRIK